MAELVSWKSKKPNRLIGQWARISTETELGAATTIPASHTYGEAIELRYTVEYTASQFQALFVNVRSDVANTSTLRGAEFSARQGAAVAIGTLEGINSAANVASSSTGDVTNAFGITGELQTDDTYTGTITAAAAVRGKFQAEDGATYTAGYVFQADLEAVTSAKAITAILGVGTASGGATVNSLIDTSALESTNYQSNTRVVLVKFKGANGTVYYVVHDTDSATALSVETAPE